MRKRDKLKVKVGTRIITQSHIGNGKYKPRKVGTVAGILYRLPLSKTNYWLNVKFDDGTREQITPDRCDLFDVALA